jgi:hypothetical protein
MHLNFILKNIILNDLLKEETLNEKDNNLEKVEEELTKNLTTQKKIEFTKLANKLGTLQIASEEEETVECEEQRKREPRSHISPSFP